MTAALILANYRTAFTAETADIDAQIAAKEEEANRVNGELRALVNRREAMESRHNAALYVALHVKVDPVTGEPVARQGKPRVVRGQEASASTAPPETPEDRPGYEAFTAAIADDRTPEQARSVLRDRGWDEAGMDMLSPTALIGVAKANLRPDQVIINNDGGAGVAGGEVIP